MTVATETQVLDEKDLGVLMQYTVEAYKTFEKLAENLPNPMVATMFKQFAVDERDARDLLDLKVQSTRTPRLRVTLGGDLAFQDIIEGEMSFRETTEFLIARE